MASPPVEKIDALTTGDLLDKYVTEMIRLWHLQDEMTSPDDEVAARAARATNLANARRVAMRAELTRRLDKVTNVDDTRTYVAGRR